MQKNIQEKIGNLTDWEFIDLVDRVLLSQFGLSATDYIEQLYDNGNEKIREIIDAIPEADIIENNNDI